MLINSNDIKTTKEHLEVMQAFIDGKEIEYRLFTPTNSMIWRISQTPMWNFDKYEYRIKPSEPEYVYPIYKRLKKRPETIIKFTSINAGIYISTHKNSIYKKYEKATSLTPHTEEDWEDCNASINGNTTELFEVMEYCDVTEKYSIRGSLYYSEDLEELQHYQKTGRSFIIDEETRQIIKVINKWLKHY